MTMKCELTGKMYQSGNNVSHAKNRTKRRFLPNIQNISFLSEKLGKRIQLKVFLLNCMSFCVVIKLVLRFRIFVYSNT